MWQWPAQSLPAPAGRSKTRTCYKVVADMAPAARHTAQVLGHTGLQQHLPDLLCLYLEFVGSRFVGVCYFALTVFTAPMRQSHQDTHPVLHGAHCRPKC